MNSVTNKNRLAVKRYRDKLKEVFKKLDYLLKKT